MTRGERSIYNRSLNWGEAELHFPGCGAAWDMMAEAMLKVPETPNLMAVWTYDHVPCPKAHQVYCDICQLEGNALVLTATVGAVVMEFDGAKERWFFRGAK